MLVHVSKLKVEFLFEASRLLKNLVAVISSRLRRLDDRIKNGNLPTDRIDRGLELRQISVGLLAHLPELDGNHSGNRDGSLQYDIRLRVFRIPDDDDILSESAQWLQALGGIRLRKDK